MTNLLRAFIVAVVWLGGPALAQAADTPRQYDIELLIFRNLVANDNGELWPQDYSSDWDSTNTNGTSPRAAVTWLPESSFRLKPERAALNRSAQYRTLAYVAWRQPVTDRADARPVSLSERGGNDTAWVDGTATVAVERYLHLALDLQLHLPGTDAQAAQIRLTEQRRMRSRELHYFDNPRFGVIALITPYEAPTKTGDRQPVELSRKP